MEYAYDFRLGQKDIVGGAQAKAVPGAAGTALAPDFGRRE